MSRSYLLTVVLSLVFFSRVFAGTKQTCGYAFREPPASDNADSSFLSACQTYQDKWYICKRASCHMDNGLQIVQDLFFVNCLGTVRNKTWSYPFVFPEGFTADDAAKKVVVQKGKWSLGQTKPKYNIPAYLRCYWRTNSDRNAKRPTCDSCKEYQHS
ncbi:hypothetical protein O181_010972 [Austropuccinia psidii MF-1]|uniref:Secreted protein n=1 Tax=Austropuccinia psidii MF-1 TaxID=1389203 RepID=A0A9Q3BUT6_9BASI|nr:hypothetical protein [Austropuccinia psidii MF-1]